MLRHFSRDLIAYLFITLYRDARQYSQTGRRSRHLCFNAVGQDDPRDHTYLWHALPYLAAHTLT